MAILGTAVFRIRPSGSNLNGGGYDAGIAGHATDYSQQNAAQASGSNATCATGTSTFIDATASAFTSAMIGNCIQIASGTNFTVGFYFVTGFTSATTVTLDRSPVGGSNGSVGVWKLGGGWANFVNIPTPATDGNIFYVLGSGTPNPAAYTYDYDITTLTNIAAGSIHCTITNDPLTPGFIAPPNTTGGMPVIKFDRAGAILGMNNASFYVVSGLWFVGTTTGATNYAISNPFGSFYCFGCVMDQFGFDCGLYLSAASGAGYVGGYAVGCEVYSSVGAGAGTIGAFNFAQGVITNCNIHDCIGYGIGASSGAFLIIINNVIAKNGVDGIATTGGGGTSYTIINNTIDGNVGNGLSLAAQSSVVLNNIFSNQTTGGKVAFTASGGVNFGIQDYNVYYNNAGTFGGGQVAGPHDTTSIVVTPYVGQTTENYTLV